MNGDGIGGCEVRKGGEGQGAAQREDAALRLAVWHAASA